MNTNSQDNYLHQRQNELENAVLEYFLEYPNACDTLKGIAEWWIVRQQIRFETTLLAKALEHLYECGLIEKIGGGESQLFKLKNDRK